MRLAVLALALAVLFTGCAKLNRLDPLPSVEQFSNNPDGMRERYKQLDEFSPTFWRYFWHAPWEGPPASKLEKQWGECDGWRLSWWDLLPGAIVPPFHVMTTWYWNAGDKQVYAIVSSSLIMGYTPRIWVIGVND
jgi:hypothetical protein